MDFLLLTLIHIFSRHLVITHYYPIHVLCLHVYYNLNPDHFVQIVMALIAFNVLVLLKIALL